jgi:hypothetical protein
VEEDVFMVDDDDGNEREMLEVEEGEVVVEELVVEVGERIEELLLEIEITVCRVVAEEVEKDGKALLEILLFMN